MVGGSSPSGDSETHVPSWLLPIYLQHFALKVTVLISTHLQDKEYGQSYVEGFNGPNLEVIYITSAQSHELEICHTATPISKRG